MHCALSSIATQLHNARPHPNTGFTTLAANTCKQTSYARTSHVTPIWHDLCNIALSTKQRRSVDSALRQILLRHQEKEKNDARWRWNGPARIGRNDGTCSRFLCRLWCAGICHPAFRASFPRLGTRARWWSRTRVACAGPYRRIASWPGLAIGRSPRAGCTALAGTGCCHNTPARD